MCNVQTLLDFFLHHPVCDVRHVFSVDATLGFVRMANAVQCCVEISPNVIT